MSYLGGHLQSKSPGTQYLGLPKSQSVGTYLLPWREPRPPGLRVRSGGLSRRSAPSDHLQAAASLSIHREFCAHSPTGAQERAGQGGPDTCESKAPSDARAGTWLGNGRGRRVGAGQPPSARPGERCKRQASVAQSHQPFSRRRTSLIHRKSRFFIVAIGKRRLRHRMRLIALSTMVCSDLAYCNASSLCCKSKSGAPWRARHRVSCLHPPWRGMDVAAGHGRARHCHTDR